MKDKGESNLTITWSKDGTVITNNSMENIIISANKTLVVITRTAFAIGDQVGNDGNYTCKVCGVNGTVDCERNTSCLKVCGEINMFNGYLKY